MQVSSIILVLVVMRTAVHSHDVKIKLVASDPTFLDKAFSSTIAIDQP
jgi:hypothetical protein